MESDSAARLLWQLSFTGVRVEADAPGQSLSAHISDKIINLDHTPSDHAFDDKVLRDVQLAWQAITGESTGFMTFDDREGTSVDDDDNE